MATQMVKVADIKGRRVAHIGRLSEQLLVGGVREFKLGRGAPACDTRVDLVRVAWIRELTRQPRKSKQLGHRSSFAL